MKTLNLITGTMTGVILTLVLTAWLASPINNYFSSDRLVGTMEIGPMAERPLPQQKATDEPKTAEQLLDELKEGLENLSRYGGSSFANLTLENNSDKVVSNIRLKFVGYSADVLLDREGEDKDVYVQNVQQFDVPDMKPGDSLNYKMWLGTSSPEYAAENLKTYSSSGEVRMSVSWPETMDEFPHSGFDKFMDDWGMSAAFVLMLVLIGILSLVSYSYEDLVKKFFKDRTLFEEHQKRFTADPKKYNPFESPKKDEANAS
ncbi:hypothetical protein [Sphingomonas daechungensis]|uniref:hypothetical protein n=1 Tax=Sphingomonas daechungensis TaxID=1176646 RepID=UPI00378439D4